MENLPMRASDPIEQFLDHRFAGHTDAAFQQQLRSETTRVIRRRRIRKRLGVAAALATCYLAGIATSRLDFGMIPNPEPRTEQVFNLSRARSESSSGVSGRQVVPEGARLLRSKTRSVRGSDSPTRSVRGSDSETGARLSLGASSEPNPIIAETTLPLDQDPDVPAVVFERVAAVSDPEQRSILFRRAGDRYLLGADESAALRCYRLALDSASDRDLIISPDDNWLLIALKKARQEEKNYVRTSS
jgi:hypothetical protein